jgi:16S rRNA processing protein RimM
MTDATQRLQVGRVSRAHGLKGEVVVKLTTNRLERLERGAILFAGPEQRALEVASSRPKDKDHLVRFVDVSYRDQADELRGLELFADALEDPDELWVHDLTGSVVVDQDGIERGSVEHVEANPASDLLVLDSGALVPAGFVVEIDDEGRIHVDVPPGLFEIND